MNRTTNISATRAQEPLQDIQTINLQHRFHQALRQTRNLEPEQRCDAMKALLKSIDTIPADWQMPALTNFAIMMAALSDEETLEVADLLIEKFQQLSSAQSADQRAENAITLINAVLSAAEMQSSDIMMPVIIKPGKVSRTLAREELAHILIREVYAHITGENQSNTAQRIIQAAELVRSLPTSLTQAYLETLHAHLPADPVIRSAALPVLLNHIQYLPGTQERQDFEVNMNQSLYQSRLAEALRH